MSENFEQRIEKKIPLTPEEKDKLLLQISEAHKIIEEKSFTLMEATEALKDLKKETDKECDEQDAIILSCLTSYRRGYSTKLVDCNVKYADGDAIFTDKETGEIIEQRPMTEGEQTRLNANHTVMDAEQYLRQKSKEEDGKDTEDE